jgi:hypothetical protein
MANYTAPEYSLVLDAVKGRKGLRSTKPKGFGFAAYVWRMARFHSGADMTMPVTCEFDLANWADHSYTKGDREAFKALREEGDKMADRVCKDLGLDDKAAARRWGRALGYL